ncbi:hypothetical protein DXT99_03105 [Pontibacter diazotrophicus]|uniref:Uncharacterized protein n=1 Tax=Pontibacter diazotrophicus TaxID=1400979 RepID=A0A3D8LH77_9BACT|nr:hypothetical protein [Pontibacter diazotrophicus]RDV16783.1 hypothetical protein DXT99_03105 [Pontibacter diazotrophicus]
MKLLLALLLLPLGFLMSSLQEPTRAFEEYTFEVTVESTTQKPALFNLSVTGVILTQNGAHEPFNMEKKNLKAPYKLNLKNGKYTVTTKAKKGKVISKVQGIKNGEQMGSANSDSKTTVLDFGFGGIYSAKGE